MIITRTPFRVSLFGGGTDLPEWFDTHGGAVVSAAIDKYCWITVRRLPPFFEHRHRVVYTKVETVMSVNEIRHPAVRVALGRAGFGDETGLEIHHDGDLPARSGMGSSSAFMVGLLLALHGMRGLLLPARELCLQAIDLERGVLGEAGGWQDQVAAAHGGLNLIRFGGDARYQVDPVVLRASAYTRLQDSLMLFWTGLARNSSEVHQSWRADDPSLEANLAWTQASALRALEMLDDVQGLGLLMHEAWALKRVLSPAVSTPAVDAIYASAKSAGALGGKLTGAGGGGFLLLVVPVERQEAVRQALRGLTEVPFRFDREGARVVHYAFDERDLAPTVAPAVRAASG